MVARRRSAPLNRTANTRVRRDTQDRATPHRATGERKTRRWRAWLLLAVLLIATLAAYQPAWRGGALWDDDAHITRSELRSVEPLFLATTSAPGTTAPVESVP
ncbi:MAG: hypothetical protein NTV05_17415 [Acidobacteria bacterium]|nr:hypothetical protein [Acidobacteriota bacterium]